jgi:hypothetical protein
MRLFSSSCTTAASTFSRGSPVRAMSAAVLALICGSTAANASRRSNFVSSRVARQPW